VACVFFSVKQDFDEHQEDVTMYDVVNRQETPERRKHRRFQPQNGAFAVLMPHFHQWGQLIDISRSGLAFHCGVAEEQPLDESLKLGILLARAGFYLRKVPFTAIADFEVAHEDAYLVHVIRRCSVKFEGLTDKQVSQLEYFIQNHTTDKS
jgi:hypothetical protein